MTRHYIIPIFVPHFGCPHDCVFCNQKKITGLSTNITALEVESIIKEHLKYFKKDCFIEIAFYGGSFTAIDIQTQSELLEIPYKYKQAGLVNEIRLSTRPDAIDHEILNNLKNYGVNTIELGCQSLDKEVLNNSNRGHTSSDVYKSSKMIQDYGFNLGLQMMIGLPGDSLEKCLYTALEFIKLKPYCVRIYPTLVIKETFLEKSYLENLYSPLTLDESIKITTPILILFYLNNINVIRVGLQPTENIQLGKDVVAGPFHPAYRQLVESNIFRLIISNYLAHNNIETKGLIMRIEAKNKIISNIVGQKSSNILYFKDKYGFKSIQIFSSDLEDGWLKIIIGEVDYIINITKEMEKIISNNLLLNNLKNQRI